MDLMAAIRQHGGVNKLRSKDERQVTESEKFKARKSQEAKVSDDPLGDILDIIKEKNKVLGYSDSESDEESGSDEWESDN